MFKVRLCAFILFLTVAFNADAAFRGYHITDVLRPDVIQLDSGMKAKLAGVTFLEEGANDSLEAVKNIVSAGYVVPISNGLTFDYNGEKIDQVDAYMFENPNLDISLMKDIPFRGFQNIEAGGLKHNISAFNLNAYLVSQGILIQEANGAKKEE